MDHLIIVEHNVGIHLSKAVKGLITMQGTDHVTSAKQKTTTWYQTQIRQTIGGNTSVTVCYCLFLLSLKCETKNKAWNCTFQTTCTHLFDMVYYSMEVTKGSILVYEDL